MDDVVTPDIFQKETPDGHSPRSAFVSVKGSHPKTQAQTDAERLADKGRDAYSLVYSHNPAQLESERAKNLTKV